ncbi:hypothetical protein BU16DRAFT_139548 [Lophium mytilinum]|uniref:Uncharacterized protein n=1 Tax=Lophium mytilinum TaxID=390894 RepID=A0A6A6QG37_9PEZI|nr:hypothetical protein BU16DRAFT_139548 [Lophium mytilinum]
MSINVRARAKHGTDLPFWSVSSLRVMRTVIHRLNGLPQPRVRIKLLRRNTSQNRRNGSSGAVRGARLSLTGTGDAELSSPATSKPSSHPQKPPGRCSCVCLNRYSRYDCEVASTPRYARWRQPSGSSILCSASGLSGIRTREIRVLPTRNPADIQLWRG